MIEEITIRDLGVIEQATLPLGPGFTALTGETGAGKTMVVTALGLLLGQRAESGVVRAGASQAVAEGHWLLPEQHAVLDRAKDAGGSTDPAGSNEAGAAVEALLMSRSVSAEGRSRAWVGGRSAPAGLLAELGEQLVVVHGQSDQLRLRSQQAQRDALDRFAGAALAEALGRYRERYDRWQRRRTELDELVTERDDRRREAEELRAAIDEIEAVSPRTGEDAALAEQAERLTNLEELRAAASAAHEAIATERLDDGVDAIGMVEQARRAVERVATHDAALAPIGELLAGVSFQLAEAATQLAGYLDGLDLEASGELDAVQERRAALASLTRRYGESIDEVLAYFDRAGLRLLELDGDDDRIEALTAEVQADAEALDALASEVTAHRREAGAALADRVSEELAALAMPDARLVVEVDEREEFAAHGRDAVSILLQPHRGADPRPLGKGASGGELSRVMLAIEVVIASSDPVPTFVFDEVDAGVGGASAIEIGKRLARLAQTAQVIVVTHLAQVAAFANNHLRVVKEHGEVTASSVQQLEGDARLEEMARLLSGLSDSESALAHARELLDAASAAVT
ncbi:DNA repair protein RecN [Ruicaihuangia caeni]|uniref:DNA repair protein RecN n=1 Tax=Ruicaihuangia caeni TaxID=3042517 RepID=UPI0033904960